MSYYYAFEVKIKYKSSRKTSEEGYLELFSSEREILKVKRSLWQSNQDPILRLLNSTAFPNFIFNKDNELFDNYFFSPLCDAIKNVTDKYDKDKRGFKEDLAELISNTVGQVLVNCCERKYSLNILANPTSIEDFEVKTLLIELDENNDCTGRQFESKWRKKSSVGEDLLISN